MHLIQSCGVEDYWAKVNQYLQVSTFLELTPADRHLLWREMTADEHWREWPLPMEVFLEDPYYVGTEVVVRPVVRQFLCDFWEPRSLYELFVFIAGIGAGKSFSASLSLLYCIYQLSCMKFPQKYLSSFPGCAQLSGDSPLMLMNASAVGARQAGKIVFQEIFTKVQHSPYFRMNFEPYDGRSSELEFPNRITLAPGTSQWQSALGWNLYGYVVDEAAFGIESERADYVRELFLTLNQRRRSRFGQLGFGGMFTSPGSEYGFVELLAADELDPTILVRRTTTWDAKDEVVRGAKVFLLDRDPDSVRILETGLTYIKPGVCQREDGSLVYFKTRSTRDVLSDGVAREQAEREAVR